MSFPIRSRNWPVHMPLKVLKNIFQSPVSAFTHFTSLFKLMQIFVSIDNTYLVMRERLQAIYLLVTTQES